MAYQLYHYTPSLPAAAVAMVLFFLSTGLHMFQLLKTRTWYFVPFVIGGFFEWIGYIGRVLGSTDEYGHWTIGPYIIQSLLLLLAPALFAASVYMVLGRIILLADGENFSLVPAKWLTKVFVLGDFISFMVQSTGGSVLAKAKSEKDKELGQWITTGGLVVQLLFFGMFIVVTAVFHRRIVRHPTKTSQIADTPWLRYLNILYAASSLIMVRCVFRVVEFVQGNDGYLVSQEVFLYIFDALLRFTMMILFNFWHPSKIVRKAS